MSPSVAHTKKGQEQDRLASYPCRRASVGSRLQSWARAVGWGGRIGRRPVRRTKRSTTAKTMVHACYEMSSWTCNSHYAGRWGGACSHALCWEWGVCGGEGMRGERKEAGWRTRWWQLRQGPSLSCGCIYGQIDRVWRADPRHDPFNSA
jgi:hypothetical protein